MMRLQVVCLFILVASGFCAESGLPENDNNFPNTEDVSGQPPPLGDETQLPTPEDDPQEDDGFEVDVPNFEIKTKSVDDIPGLTEDMLAEAIDEAKKETEEHEKRTPRQKTEVLQSHYRRFVPELEPARIKAMIMERTIKRLAAKLGMTHNEAARKLEGLQHDHLNQLYADQENSPRHCPTSPYRSITGHCNNRKNHSWGEARTPFRRILRPDYSDGISKPRRAKNGKPLPNARNVSRTVFKEDNVPSMKLSHMTMTWGQFLDHDITIGAQPDIDCKGKCGLAGECFGIPVPKDDTPFTSKGKTCIELKRDVPAPHPAGLSYREQVNQITSYIDASQVYGSEEKLLDDLRLAGTPFLRSMKNPRRRFKDLLPKQVGGFCRSSDVSTMPCFKAGDERSNENAALGSMHTIWLREHNHIATELKKLNRRWNANKVFEETRKIVGAMIQHITYNEFLPLILDTRTRRRFNLLLRKKGFYRGYKRNLDATISNSFAAAAYRFGHSLVQDQMSRFNKRYRRINPSIPMNRFLDPTFLYQTNKGGVDSILRGLAKDKAQTVDRFFAKAVQEQLVRSKHDLADLPALNIQRAREHGVPGYNAFRKWAYGLPRGEKTTFKDLRCSIPYNRLKLLEEVYDHPDDIDLFVGALYEEPLPGAVLGRVFSFILGEQFRRLKRGDRFWYENRGVFTRKQLQEIRKVRLSSVICRNGDKIVGMQPWALAARRRRWSCRKLRYKYSMDLRKWRESRHQGDTEGSDTTQGHHN